MKVVIACSGLGNVQRGYETFAEDLFRNLEATSEVDATLFKGGGVSGPREIRLWNLPRSSPIWGLTGRSVDPYIVEQMTFALAVARQLKKEGSDIVHISDGQLGSSLLRLFPGSSRNFKILFTNGGALAPSHYERFDYVQQVNPVELERASAHGFPGRRMALLPHGVSVANFRSEGDESARRRFGIPEGVPIVLTVGAHEPNKRLDFLINGLARIERSCQFLVVGETVNGETQRLRSLAQNLLGERVTFVTLPYDVMPRAYALADLYVHGSLREGFGLTLLEAMASGLPIIHHNESAMNWILGDAGVAVDMTKADSFSEAALTVLSDSSLRARLAHRARRRARERFSWEVLLPFYSRMYEEALSLPLST